VVYTDFRGHVYLTDPDTGTVSMRRLDHAARIDGLCWATLHCGVGECVMHDATSYQTERGTRSTPTLVRARLLLLVPPLTLAA